MNDGVRWSEAGPETRRLMRRRPRPRLSGFERRVPALVLVADRAGAWLLSLGIIDDALADAHNMANGSRLGSCRTTTSMRCRTGKSSQGQNGQMPRPTRTARSGLLTPTTRSTRSPGTRSWSKPASATTATRISIMWTSQRWVIGAKAGDRTYRAGKFSKS